MAFTEAQLKSLEAKLDGKRIKTREQNGATLSYLEGWHVIAEANRIFGYDAWDRRTRANACVWSGTKNGYYFAAYTAKVRVTVRAGAIVVVREGSGTGEGKALTPGQAHELALKAAETDATKRALATFGNPFGLALYDHEQSGVRKSRTDKKSGLIHPPYGPLVMRSATGGAMAKFDKVEDFTMALREALNNARNVELLFDTWKQNLETVRLINNSATQNSIGKACIADELLAHFKSCAARLGRPDKVGEKNASKIDKSLLAISETKRHRSKEHLRHVAQQPCVICGRTPSHAHHIRYAQPKGAGLKVSDEFTVPLCAIHHTQNHATGNERRWWQDRKIDPLPIAAALWRESNSTGDQPVVE
jgi:DNA recombination protein Rad52